LAKYSFRSMARRLSTVILQIKLVEQSRQIDVVAITKLDRLARSVHHLVALGRELEALGVDLVVLDQTIDTTTPRYASGDYQRLLAQH
jgi:DNA invertase Pin-like site-specific DNA recombinase